jgi:peptidoglycan/LPS O-acetylase OafA/YrhL
MKKDNANLDMLRSFAVLVVLTVHLLISGFHIDAIGPVDLRRFGQWGVLMFFVHTCLVLLYSLERKPEFWPFLLRRVFRIYPLSMITVLIVVGFSLPMGYAGDHFVLVSRSVKNVFLNLALLQNLHGGESVIAPLWSLPYEMQMYLLLPAVFYLLKWKERFVEYLLWMVGLFLATHSLWAEAHGLPGLTFFPCFLAGAVAYRGSQKYTVPSWLWPVAVVGITLLFAARPSGRTGWFCCLLLGMAIPRFKELSSPFVKQCVATIAKYSYGIYLLHLICIWIAFEELNIFPVVVKCLAFLAMLVGSVYFAYHVIEAPMIQLGSRLVGWKKKERLTSLVGINYTSGVGDFGRSTKFSMRR